MPAKPQPKKAGKSMATSGRIGTLKRIITIMNDQDSASGKQWHVERMRQLEKANATPLKVESPEAKAQRLADIENTKIAKARRVALAIEQMLERHAPERCK
jgi:hypothetical protein